LLVFFVFFLFFILWGLWGGVSPFLGFFFLFVGVWRFPRPSGRVILSQPGQHRFRWPVKGAGKVSTFGSTYSPGCNVAYPWTCRFRPVGGSARQIRWVIFPEGSWRVPKGTQSRRSCTHTTHTTFKLIIAIPICSDNYEIS
jgi:hypothetical protein